MIAGLGTDIVDIRRIAAVLERTGTGFVKRIIHPSEHPDFESLHMNCNSPEIIRFVASRFAAKEAGAKALGTGFRQGVAFLDIRVFPMDNGKPTLHFFGQSANIAQSLGVTHTHLSLSHEKKYAVATVILESS